MTNTNRTETLVQDYSDQLLALLQKNQVTGPRTYGFEYEFLPDFPLNLSHMDKLYRFMPEMGFEKQDAFYMSSSGLYITFEPGGQIEYHGIPQLPEDDDAFNNQLSVINTCNREIEEQLGIKYIATDYMPHRSQVPLCLVTERYRNLHDRLSYSGTRGLEMMKATASIHLHAAIRNTGEVASLFSAMSRMSSQEPFKMGADRRDIWDNTDETRCGLLFNEAGDQGNDKNVIEEIVRFALNAFDINRKRLFYEIENTAFEDFLYHMTTIFTDIRLNIKGPTFELRTLDSMPFAGFRERWKQFIAKIEEIYCHT